MLLLYLLASIPLQVAWKWLSSVWPLFAWRMCDWLMLLLLSMLMHPHCSYGGTRQPKHQFLHL